MDDLERLTNDFAAIGGRLREIGAESERRAQQRIDSILAASDGPLKLGEIAERAGVSRQRVHQLLPNYARSWRRDVLLGDAAKLGEYIKSHPEALRSHQNGGPGKKAIAQLLDLPLPRLNNAWHHLNLSPLQRAGRSDEESRERRRRRRHERYLQRREEIGQQNAEWKRRNPERLREIQAKAGQAYRQRHRERLRRHRLEIVGEAICPACRQVYPLPRWKQKAIRELGRPVSCSRSCGRRLATERKLS